MDHYRPHADGIHEHDIPHDLGAEIHQTWRPPNLTITDRPWALAKWGGLHQRFCLSCRFSISNPFAPGNTAMYSALIFTYS